MWLETSGLVLIFCHLFHSAFLFACCKNECTHEQMFSKLHCCPALDSLKQSNEVSINLKIFSPTLFLFQFLFSFLRKTSHRNSRLPFLHSQIPHYSYISRLKLSGSIWYHLWRMKQKNHLFISMWNTNTHHQNCYGPNENLVMKDKNM